MAEATSLEGLALAEAAATEEKVPDQPTKEPESTETGGEAAESPTEPAAEEAPPDEQGGDDAGEASEEPREQDILAYMKDVDPGLDLAKYKNDEAFLKGAGEAMRALGRREEDAQLGKQVRGVLGDQPDQLQALLEGQVPTTPAIKEPENGKPETRPEWNPAWVTQNKEGQLVPAMGAPKDIEEKYQRYTSWKDQRVHELVTDPEKFFGAAMDKRDETIEEKSRAAAQAEVTQHQQSLDMQALAEKHRNLLHVDGDPEKGASAEGHRVADLYVKWEKKIPNDLDRLEFAINEVRHGQPKPPPRRPRGKAVRQAGVAPVEPETKTVLELVKSGVSADGSPMGLAEAYAKGVD